MTESMPKLSINARHFFRRQKPPQFLWRLCGFLVIKVLNAWMSTLSYRGARYDPVADPADENFCGPAIYVFWHEYIPMPIYARPNCRLSMLLSQHQDAEVLSHVAHFAGMEVVRGSSNRGGTTALREMIERGKGMSLAITPDGPRGPRRKLAQGCVYLSSRLQIPLVLIGVGYDRPWRNRSSWDQFAFPRPFSRCRAIMGPRIQIEPNLDRDAIEQNRQWVESQLECLTKLAEDWAERRCNVRNSEILFRSPQRGSGKQTNSVLQHGSSLSSPDEASPHFNIRAAS